MKRPNGYGSIINLGKGRRKPYAVRIMDREKSFEPNEDGSYTRKYVYIGYFEKKAEAQDCLDAYNANKTPVQYKKITFAEVFHLWAAKNIGTGSKSREYSYKAAFDKCTPVHDRSMVDLRLADLQKIIDSYGTASRSTLNNIKIVMGAVFDYAMKNDIIEKDYAKFVEIPTKKQENHPPLTHLQVETLKAENNPVFYQKMILIYLYTGCRPSELCELKKEDVHITEQYIHIRKAKTAAGVRLVPIADKILPLVREFYEKSENDLFFGGITYPQYKDFYKQVFPETTPHSTRSTFISFMAEKDVPQIIIQKIVGHASGTVTGDVYTRLSLRPLLDAVNKL